MAVKIFFCYAREDEAHLNQLKRHLRPLQRQGLIEIWHDRDISAGTEWEREIDKHLKEADIILLLVSPDFMDSDYCYGIEMKQAIERHKRGEAHVIPIIFRYVYWQGVLGQLQALPTDALPITDPNWHNIDRALYNVTEGIRKVVEELISKSAAPLPVPPIQPASEQSSLQVLPHEPRKSLPAMMSGDLLIKPEDFSLLKTLTGHSEWITSIMFSPDGQTLISASDDDTIKLWSLQTGELLHTFTGHSEGIRSAALSPDGRTLAGGGTDGTIKLWNIQKWELLHTLTGHSQAIGGVAFNPDGHTLASGSKDHTIKLWNLQTGELLYTLIGHSTAICSIAFSPNGQILASGSCNVRRSRRDTKIKLWNLQRGELFCTLTGHSAAICSIAFSPDGQTLASGSDDKTIKIWGKK